MTRENSLQPITKFVEYLRVILRHKWHALIGASVCFFVLCVIIAKLPNQYEATTTILVDPQQVPEKYVSPAVNSDPGERLNTITQQVLSRTRLASVISMFHLYSDSSGQLSQDELIEEMRDHIRIQVRQGAGPQLSTFTISFQGETPTVVAAVTNELASSFIQWNIDSREQQVEGTQAFVGEELNAAKTNLEQQEDKLRDFKMTHLGETPDQTSINLESMSALRSSLQANMDSFNRLQQEKLLLTRLPAQAALPSGSAQVLSRRDRLELERTQAEGELQRLKASYSERYPDVVKLKHRLDEITAELSSTPHESPAAKAGQTEETSATSVRLELIDSELNRLHTEQARIQQQMASYQAKVDAAPLREQQLVDLSRNYDVSKQHYQMLLDKSFNIKMAASLEQKQKGERFTVLDSASIPEKPVKPRRKLLLAVAALFSLTFPCLLVIGKELLTAAVTTEEELKSLLPPRVRIVGLIPRIDTSEAKRRKWLVASASLLASLLLGVSTAWVLWHMRSVL
jgi:polysaccharide biosynthesis transport protein